MSNTLPVSLLLGTDAPKLGELLQTPALLNTKSIRQNSPSVKYSWKERAQLSQRNSKTAGNESGTQVVTVTEQKTLFNSECNRELEHQQAESFVVTHLQDKREADNVASLQELPFTNCQDDPELFSKGAIKKLSRREQKEAKQQYVCTDCTEPQLPHSLVITPGELRQLQDMDCSLDSVRKAADGQRSRVTGEGIFRWAAIPKVDSC